MRLFDRARRQLPRKQIPGLRQNLHEQARCREQPGAQADKARLSSSFLPPPLPLAAAPRCLWAQWAAPPRPIALHGQPS